MSDVPPGSYRASDGRVYPVPPGYYLASDGQLYPLAPPVVAAPIPGPGPTPTWRRTTGGVGLLAGGLLTIIGSILPWAAAGPFEVSGLEAHGGQTLLLAIGALILGGIGIRTKRRGFTITALLFAMLIVLTAAGDMADVGALTDLPLIEVQVGSGLILTLIGGLMLVAGSFLNLTRRRR